MVLKQLYPAEAQDKALEKRAKQLDLDPDAIEEESFGRHLGVRDPDGLRIQIDEHARDIRHDAPPGSE